MMNMGSLQSMMDVANRCQGYTPVESGMTSAIGSENSRSCENCQHLSNHQCKKDLYDEVMASIF